MSQLSQIKSRISQFMSSNLTEADTSRIIIEPILQWLGYDVYDWETVREQVTIQEGSLKGNDGRADYGIRIRGAFCFMIEAKRLGSSSVQDVLEIKKTLDYCNHSDRPRFAILTDGRVWRIFDNHVGGAPSSRELIEIDFLENHARLTLLKPTFFKSLQKHSDLVSAVKISNVKTQKPLLDLLLKNMLDELELELATENIVPPPLELTIPRVCFDEDLSLFDIWEHEPTHKTPKKVVFNDVSKVVYVNKWTLVLFEIFRHLSISYAPQMESMKRPRGGAMFPKESLNYKTPQNISAHTEKPLIFEMNGSSSELLSKLKYILNELNIPKDMISVFCD